MSRLKHIKTSSESFLSIFNKCVKFWQQTFAQQHAPPTGLVRFCQIHSAGNTSSQNHNSH